MNPVEYVLNDEVNRLLDRLAASVPARCLQAAGEQSPTLRRRLDEAEAQVATVRASLLESYGRWRRGLDDIENLWALAAWKAAGPDASAEPPAAPERSTAREALAAKEPAEESRSLAA